MERFFNPLPNGGAPFYSDDFTETMQSEYYRAMIAMMVSAGYDNSVGSTAGWILSGLEVSAINVGLHTASFTEGYVLLDSQIVYVAAYSGDYNKWLCMDTATITTRVFNDATVQNFSYLEKTKLLGAQPGGVGSIDLRPTTINDYRGPVNALLYQKADKIQNGWLTLTPTGLGWSVTPGYSLEYRIGTTGILSFRGSISHAAVPASSIPFQMIVGERPFLQTMSKPLCSPLGVGLQTIGYSMSMGTNGNFTIFANPSGGAADIALDGVFYYLD